ncbi:hypothetical protein HAX54_008698 [Datura stramonium]|uniref:Uncharacterized protein n=1 Tax=Datura stramonium TaxID=4076 RepID=A0ABS8TDQ9_DATST|nr:hypothetical protein [Datura stramonium]
MHRRQQGQCAAPLRHAAVLHSCAIALECRVLAGSRVHIGSLLSNGLEEEDRDGKTEQEMESKGALEARFRNNPHLFNFLLVSLHCVHCNIFSLGWWLPELPLM